MNRTAIVRAMAQLIQDGVVEDSGLRRPDTTGRMQVAWRTSAFGDMVSEYQERLGLTFEQALTKAKAEASDETLSPTRATDVPGGDSDIDEDGDQRDPDGPSLARARNDERGCDPEIVSDLRAGGATGGIGAAFGPF